MRNEPGKEPILQVLCIEDNEDDSMLMERYLRDSPIKEIDFMRAKTLRQAIEYAARPSMRPDIVIMDLDLEDARGREVFDQFHSVYEAVPIIVVSGAYNEKMRDVLMRAGAANYFDKNELKPVNLLFNAVEKALSWTKRRLNP